MYACADRYCVSGRTVEVEGTVCADCAPAYHAADLAGEDEVSTVFKHQNRDTAGYYV